MRERFPEKTLYYPYDYTYLWQIVSPKDGMKHGVRVVRQQ